MHSLLSPPSTLLTVSDLGLAILVEALGIQSVVVKSAIYIAKEICVSANTAAQETRSQVGRKNRLV